MQLSPFSNPFLRTLPAYWIAPFAVCLVLFGCGDDGPDEPAVDVLEAGTIAAGADFSCAIDPDGAIECWGADGAQTEPPSGTFRQLDVYNRFGCAVEAESNNVRCWGSSTQGATATPEGEFERVATGNDTSCGLRPDGVIHCWGRPIDSAPDEDNDNNDNIPQDPDNGDDNGDDETVDDFEEFTSENSAFVDVATGHRYVCGLTEGRDIECWGYGAEDPDNGRAGDFGQANPPDERYLALNIGRRTTCTIHFDGHAHCFGHDSNQQAQPSDELFRQVSVAEVHGCGIVTDDSVECWGTYAEDPQEQEALDRGQANPPSGTFVEVTTGDRHTCGILDSGDIECWGADDDGQASPPSFGD